MPGYELRASGIGSDALPTEAQPLPLCSNFNEIYWVFLLSGGELEITVQNINYSQCPLLLVLLKVNFSKNVFSKRWYLGMVFCTEISV